jgi:hypothetical protein
MNVERKIENPLFVAKKMWERCQYQHLSPNWSSKKPHEKMSDFNGFGFSDFIKEYSIVSRQMIVNREFNSKAFKRYLKRLKNVGYHSQEDWAMRQAEYMEYLCLELNKGSPNIKGIAKELKDSTYESLIDEMNSFKKDFKEAKTKAAEEIENDRKKMLDKLKILMKNKKIQNKLLSSFSKHDTKLSN